MHRTAAAHLRLIVAAFLIVVFAGAVFDEILLFVSLFFALYSLWMTRQAFRLHSWLYSGDYKNVPEAYGLWGDLFEGLYHSARKNKKARKRLSKMIKRIRNSANALKDAVVMTDDAGQMDWWNNAATLLFGFDNETDQGQLITNLLRDPEFKTYFEDKHYDNALEIKSPLDQSVMVRVHITLFGKSERLILAQDITRLHHLEQMRKDFASNVSHEMRTPLTVIRGYVEMMMDSDDAPDRWRRALSSMETQTLRLESIISDLLTLEKYEAIDGSDLEGHVRMADLLESICEDARLYSGDRGHVVELTLLSTSDLYGEEGQLRSAISNLVYNAIKYTPDGGVVSVEWSEDQEGCHLSVKDTGCGFDPVHIPRLTERFYRADPSRNKNTGGTGLGLAIVKHVLINHNASLEVHSEVDQGSEFICHFPRINVLERED